MLKCLSSINFLSAFLKTMVFPFGIIFLYNLPVDFIFVVLSAVPLIALVTATEISRNVSKSDRKYNRVTNLKPPAVQNKYLHHTATIASMSGEIFKIFLQNR